MNIHRPSQLGYVAAVASVIVLCIGLATPYDVNADFDVETTDTIVCSELIYQVYTGIEWPTQKALGRSTISPDHIAVRALNGGAPQLVAFHRDGKRVEEGPLERMAALVASSRDKK